MGNFITGVVEGFWYLVFSRVSKTEDFGRSMRTVITESYLRALFHLLGLKVVSVWKCTIIFVLPISYALSLMLRVTWICVGCFSLFFSTQHFRLRFDNNVTSCKCWIMQIVLAAITVRLVKFAYILCIYYIIRLESVSFGFGSQCWG